MDNLLFLNQLAAANRGAPYRPGWDRGAQLQLELQDHENSVAVDEVTSSFALLTRPETHQPTDRGITCHKRPNLQTVLMPALMTGYNEYEANQKPAGYS